MIRCNYCPRITLLDEAGARFRGWRIYTGHSLTGKDIKDVICLKCSGRGKVEDDEELIPSWDVCCKTCGWQFSDEWDEQFIPLLDEREAYAKAQMHHCTPEFQYMDQGGRHWLDQDELDKRIQANHWSAIRVPNIDLSSFPVDPEALERLSKLYPPDWWSKAQLVKPEEIDTRFTANVYAGDDEIFSPGVFDKQVTEKRPVRLTAFGKEAFGTLLSYEISEDGKYASLHFEVPQGSLF